MFSSPKPAVVDISATPALKAIQVQWKQGELKEALASKAKGTSSEGVKVNEMKEDPTVRVAWQPSGRIWWGETQFTAEWPASKGSVTVEALEPNDYRVSLEAWVPTDTAQGGSWECISDFIRVTVAPEGAEAVEKKAVEVNIEPGYRTLTLTWDPKDVQNYKFIRPMYTVPGYLWNSWKAEGEVEAASGKAIVSGLLSGTEYTVGIEGGNPVADDQVKGNTTEIKWTPVVSGITGVTKSQSEEEKHVYEVAETMEALKANFDAAEAALRESKLDSRQMKARVAMMEQSLQEAEKRRQQIEAQNRRLMMASDARVVAGLWNRGGAAWKNFLRLKNPESHLDQLITLAGGDEHLEFVMDVIEQCQSPEEQIEKLITLLPSAQAQAQSGIHSASAATTP